MNASPAARLRAALASGRLVVAPGCHDALSAALAERTGFDCAYVSSAGVACTRFGRPDVDLVGMNEVADTLSAIGERVALPLVADAGAGFGNALNVQRTVRLFERVGAAAIQLDDRQVPTRPGADVLRPVVATRELVGKLHAALDARADQGTLVIARIGAAAVEGLEPALERAERCLEAGADLLHVETGSAVELGAVLERFRGRVPVVARAVERAGGAGAAELERLGVALALFPDGLVRSLARAALEYLAGLQATGSTAAVAARMLEAEELEELLGTESMRELSRRYGGG